MMERSEMLNQITAIMKDEENLPKMEKITPLLHGKWELQIALELCRQETLRFGQIKKILPNKITNTVLTDALRNLESLGLVTRVQYNEIPPRVEYTPTEKCQRLLPVYYEIIKWCLEND